MYAPYRQAPTSYKHITEKRIKDIRVDWWQAVLLDMKVTLSHRKEPSTATGLIRLLPNYNGESFRSKKNGVINLTMKFSCFPDSCVLKLMELPEGEFFEVMGLIEENYTYPRSSDYDCESYYKLAIRGLYSAVPGRFSSISTVAQAVFSKSGMI